MLRESRMKEPRIPRVEALALYMVCQLLQEKALRLGPSSLALSNLRGCLSHLQLRQ